MTQEADRFARQKLATEMLAKRVDQRLARQQFALAQSQFDHQKNQATRSGFAALLTPTGVVLAGAALGLLGTAAGKYADTLNTKRQQETAIILKASDVPSNMEPEKQAEQRALNLLWFSEAHYIDLPDAFVARLRSEAKVAKGAPIAAPVFQSSAATAPEITAKHEGFTSTTQKLPDGNHSIIGFGHYLNENEAKTGVVKIGDRVVDINSGLSKDDAMQLLKQDMRPFYAAVDRLVKVPLSPSQRDTLADLTFNIGAGRLARSSLLEKLNRGDYAAVPDELMKLTKLAGREFPGLKERREEEAKLWRSELEGKTGSTKTP